MREDIIALDDDALVCNNLDVGMIRWDDGANVRLGFWSSRMNWVFSGRRILLVILDWDELVLIIIASYTWHPTSETRR